MSNDGFHANDPFCTVGNGPQSAVLRKFLDEKSLGKQDASRLGWSHLIFPIPHEMIRVEMKRLRTLSDPKLFADTVPTNRATSLRVYFEELPKPIIDAHHDSEEKVWFPQMKANMELPERIAHDHKDLLDRLDDVSAKLAALEAAADKGSGDAEAATAAARAAHEAIVTLDEKLEEHLQEEESLAPAIGENLTPEWFDEMGKKQGEYSLTHHPPYIVAMEFAAILFTADKWG